MMSSARLAGGACRQFQCEWKPIYVIRGNARVFFHILSRRTPRISCLARPRDTWLIGWIGFLGSIYFFIGSAFVGYRLQAKRGKREIYSLRGAQFFWSFSLKSCWLNGNSVSFSSSGCLPGIPSFSFFFAAALLFSCGGTVWPCLFSAYLAGNPWVCHGSKITRV